MVFLMKKFITGKTIILIFTWLVQDGVVELKLNNMSLDVTLYRNYLVSYDEGVTLEPRREEVYSANITHNLGKMADEAGLYEALWRPHRLKPGYDIPEDDYKTEWEYEDNNPVRAHEIIEIVEKGLEDMKARPKHYETFNSPNGWGMYHNFVPWIERYLAALKEFPESQVVCDR
jgi:hypothetical protein